MSRSIASSLASGASSGYDDAIVADVSSVTIAIASGGYRLNIAGNRRQTSASVRRSAAINA